MTTDNRRTPATWGKNLVAKIICPNCWHSFRPEECLYIARHPDLIGDPIAGPNEYLRFEATRFSVKGDAIDPRGFETADVACPRCHLQIPEAMLEVPPLFISVVGAPASGKSYFLTAMCWQLRRTLPKLGLSFSDADPVRNSAIQRHEQMLFMNPAPDQPTEIPKTERDAAHFYRTVLQNGVAVRYPIPLQFSLWPTPEHPRYSIAREVGRLVVMYDNAGEDFLPGAVDGVTPVIRHLARSHVAMVFFDPTQDSNFRRRCPSGDPQLSGALRPGQLHPPAGLRQETLLREAAVRMRQYLGMSEEERVKRPLIVVVPKFDLLETMTGISLDTEPYTEGKPGRPPLMDLERVEQASGTLRDLFRELCPEFVAAAESLSVSVRYIPVSALGGSPVLIQREGQSFYGIRPQDIRPRWVTVPLLYCLCRWAPGTLGASSRAKQEDIQEGGQK